MKGAMLLGTLKKKKAAADFYLMHWLPYCGSDELGKSQTVSLQVTSQSQCPDILWPSNEPLNWRRGN